MLNGALALSILGGGQQFASSSGGAALAIPAFRRAAAAGAEDKGITQAGKDPQLQRTLERFKEAVTRAPDVKTALKDPRVLAVVLPALGLADAVDKPALAMRALTSDPAKPDSLVNQLSDRRWLSAAKTLDLSRRGLDALRDPKIQAVLEKGLAQVTWREGLNEATPGVSDALYFRERASSVKNAYDILGDAVLRRVVTKALGLPDSLAVQTVEAQARTITSRLKIESLSDSRQVAKFAERYVITRASEGGGTAGSSPLLSLLA